MLEKVRKTSNNIKCHYFHQVSHFLCSENTRHHPEYIVRIVNCCKSGPEVIKLFSCSTQQSMKFFLLINVKMPTSVGIFTFMSRKNSILDLAEPEKKC